MDTTGWAESWGTLSGRIIEGFEAIARGSSWRWQCYVVSHGMTITTLIYLIDPKAVQRIGLGQR